jgi:hypothetical protein
MNLVFDKLKHALNLVNFVVKLSFECWKLLFKDSSLNVLQNDSFLAIFFGDICPKSGEKLLDPQI